MKLGKDFNLEEARRNHAQTIEEIAILAKNVAKLQDTLTKWFKGYQEQNITLYTYDNTFRAEGFQFNSLYVSDAAASDAAKLVITASGVQYTITLVAGENTVNIPDGASYRLTTTSSSNYPALLTRYNMLKA